MVENDDPKQMDFWDWAKAFEQVSVGQEENVQFWAAARAYFAGMARMSTDRLQSFLPPTKRRFEPNERNTLIRAIQSGTGRGRVIEIPNSRKAAVERAIKSAEER